MPLDIRNAPDEKTTAEADEPGRQIPAWLWVLAAVVVLLCVLGAMYPGVVLDLLRRLS